MSPIKETNYLAYDPADPGHSNPVKTQQHYESLFDGVKNEKVVGEASPSYLHSDHAIQRISELIPRPKLVVSLRNPVDRTYSAYLMARRNGIESGELPEAFQPDANWVQRSFCADRLARYIEVFGREHLKIFLFDDLQRNAGGVARELFEFLEVDPGFKPNIDYRHNPGGLPRSGTFQYAYRKIRRNGLFQAIIPQGAKRLAVRLRDKNLVAAPALPAEIRADWAGFFEAEVLALQELIGRDLSGWAQANRDSDLPPG